jgi:hypothetical protein
VAAARREQPPALARVGRVDEVAGGEDRPEATAEVEVLDPGVDRLDGAGVREHRLGFVDPGHGVAESGERAGEAPDAAAEVEDGGVRRHRGVEHGRRLTGRDAEVDLDRAAVGGDVVRHGVEVHVRAVIPTGRAPASASRRLRRRRSDRRRLSADAPGKAQSRVTWTAGRVSGCEGSPQIRCAGAPGSPACTLRFRPQESETPCPQPPSPTSPRMPSC